MAYVDKYMMKILSQINLNKLSKSNWKENYARCDRKGQKNWW